MDGSISLMDFPTSTTNPIPMIEEAINSIEWMPTDAVSPCRISSNNGLSTHQILTSSNWFQVERIHASWDTAEMIQVQTKGNWPNIHLIGDLMSQSHSLANIKSSIAKVVKTRCPQPTSIRYMNFSPELLFKSTVDMSRMVKHRVTSGVMGRAFTALRPSLLYCTKGRID